jgi:hypothetical protein
MDILKTIKELRERLFAKYGNPLEKYKETQDDVHMTYYVGTLMEELGHKWVSPSRISGEKVDRAHYSEKALHDAFLAGRLIERVDRAQMRKQVKEEIKAELADALEDL